jgi:hypothetical protein
MWYVEHYHPSSMLSRLCHRRFRAPQARQWTSFESTLQMNIPSDLAELVESFIAILARRVGVTTARHCLQYLTACVFGVSNMEMDEILSLDDDVLDELLPLSTQTSFPQLRRAPHGAWLAILTYLEPYVCVARCASTPVTKWLHPAVRSLPGAYSLLVMLSVMIYKHS